MTTLARLLLATMLLAAMVSTRVNLAYGNTAAQEPPATQPAAGEATEDAPVAEGVEVADGAQPATAQRRVLLGEIDGEITLTEAAYVKRLMDTAKGYDVVALRLNTFGGRVDAAVAIRDALLDAEIPTVVWIDRRAISAGALISLACEKIAMTKGGTIGAATPITSSPGQEMAQPVEEKVLSYFRQEMRATAEARGRNGDIAEAMVDAEKEVEGVSVKGELLTLTTTKALELQIADVEADSLEAALEALGLSGTIEPLDRSWAEGLAGFLTSSAIASMLLLGMMVFGYLELQTPGFGFFGLAAISCFLLLYFGHTLVNLAGWEELLLFGIGALLLGLELFVLPGFGIAGVLGALAIVIAAAMVVSTGEIPTFTLENPFTREALTRVALTAVAGVGVLILAARFLPSKSGGAFGGRLVLDRTLDAAAGYTSHGDGTLAALVGTGGIATTPLRPAGKASFGARRLDVETEGDFLEKGAAIVAIEVHEGKLVVRRAPTTPEAPAAPAGDTHA